MARLQSVVMLKATRKVYTVDIFIAPTITYPSMSYYANQHKKSASPPLLDQYT